MDRNATLRRRANVLAGACVIFLGLTLVRGATEKEVASGKALPATFVGIDVDKVRVVEVEGPSQRDGKPVKQTVRLERTGVATWVLASSDGYPADPKKVEDFVKKLADVRTKAENTTNREKFSTFGGPDGFTEVRLFGDGDEPILSFGIGKGNAEGSYGNTFLRIDDVAKKGGRPAVPGEPPTARIVAATDVDAWGRTEVTSWIETRIWSGLADADVVAMDWKHLPKSFDARLVHGTKSEKDGSGKDGEESWTLERPVPGGAAKADSAKQIVQSFVGLAIAGLEGRTGPGVDEKYGFDKPDLVLVATGKSAKDGRPAPSWQLEIGKKIDGKSSWYARRSLLTGPDSWIFSVNDYELGRYRDDPLDLLEKKPEPPAPPPAPAMDDAAMGDAAMGDAAMADEPAPGMGEPPPVAPGEPAMTDSPPAPPVPAMDEPPPPEEPAMTDAPPRPPR